MYLVDSFGTLVRSRNSGKNRPSLRGSVTRNVVLIGVVSMLTDISSEMISAILPLYLVITVGLSPLQFGAIDGLYQGGAALVRLAGGFFSDRLRRHKEVAGLGYGLSAICKIGFLVVGSSASAIGAVVLLDRTGKGLRTAPRDALISLSSKASTLGVSFGVHRALDTFGAMIGPLVAFLFLSIAPGRYDAIFVVSFCFALLGLAVLVLFVENRSGRPTEDGETPAAPEAEPADVPQRPTVRSSLELLNRRDFRWLGVTACLLSLVSISDAFIYLGLQRRYTFDPRFLPLFYVGTALSYMLLAAPVGRLADRIGRMNVFLGGYVLLLIVYTSLVIPTGGGAALIVAYLGLLGAYYAATDGVLMAIASRYIPPELRATGLGILTTGTSLAKIAGSVAFGALWTWKGLTFAVIVFGVALALALVAAAISLKVRDQMPTSSNEAIVQ